MDTNLKVERAHQALQRDEQARVRDLAALSRDRAAEARDRHAEGLAVRKQEGSADERNRRLERALAGMRSQAAADRERAREDREAARKDREQAAQDRRRTRINNRAKALEEFLPAVPDSVGQARRDVAKLVSPPLDGRALDDLLLGVSEAVANAVQHGSANETISLSLEIAGGQFRVLVSDSSPAFAQPPGQPSPVHNGGWGLFLIETVANRWGLERDNDQTHVWFEMHPDAAAS